MKIHKSDSTDRKGGKQEKKQTPFLWKIIKYCKCGADPKSHLFQPLYGMQASTSVQNGEINCTKVTLWLRTEIQLESSSPISLPFFFFFSVLAPLMLVNVLVAQSCLTLFNPMDCSPSGSCVHGILQKEYWSGESCPPLGDLSDPGTKPRSPALQADSSPSKPPGKPFGAK